MTEPTVTAEASRQAAEARAGVYDDDLPDTCNYSHRSAAVAPEAPAASTETAPAADAAPAPEQTVIPSDTGNLDTD